MASRKMTFTLPEEVAAELLHRVASRDRSSYVTQAITAKLREREERLIQACQAANIDPDVEAIEAEWETLSDAIPEPWSDASTR